MNRWLSRMRLGVLLCGLGLAGCATNPVTGRSDLVTMTEQQEVSIGQRAHQQILQQYQIYDEAQLQIYVSNVGQRVATHGHRPGLSYEFYVLDSPEINAFALPGGYIYVTRGLLSYLNSEAELAAVLAHEVGHVTARHAVRQQSSAQLASVGTGLLSIFIPQLGMVGRQTLSLVGEALLRGYGREQELEADRLSAEYLARAGYDPSALLNVLSTLKAQESLDQRLAQLEGRQARAYHGMFSTHPDNDTRLREGVTAARQFAVNQGEVGRDPYLDEIDGLIVGNNPRQGVIRDNRFLHPGLDFSLMFPTGWALQNLPNKLVATEPGGFAQAQVNIADASPDETPEAVLARLGVREFIKGRRFQAEQAAGVTGFTRLNVQGGLRTVRLSLLLHQGYAFVITGITAREQDLAQFDPAFYEVAASFRRLTAEERAKIKPRQLRVVDLNGPVTWQSLAKASPLKRLPQEQLMVLNAAAPSEVSPQIRRIKIVE